MESLIKKALGLIEHSARLSRAAEYSVLGGGKRIRPKLIAALTQDLGGSAAAAEVVGVSVELLHAASLVHDDLPALDNDKIRRGKPTCHIQFGGGAAVLLGDVLPMLSLRMVLDSEALGTGQKLEAMRILTLSYSRLCEGQDLDIDEQGQGFEGRELIHALKTGALFSACFELAGICCGLNDSEDLQLLCRAGLSLGSLFQKVDDLHDLAPGSSVSPLREEVVKVHREVLEFLDGLGARFSKGKMLPLENTRALVAQIWA